MMLVVIFSFNLSTCTLSEGTEADKRRELIIKSPKYAKSKNKKLKKKNSPTKTKSADGDDGSSL